MSALEQKQNRVSNMSGRVMNAVGLDFMGLNKKEIPKGAEVLSVSCTTHHPHYPIVHYLHERDAPREIQHFYVSSPEDNIPGEGDLIDLGGFIGTTQYPGQMAKHVWFAKPWKDEK